MATLSNLIRLTGYPAFRGARTRAQCHLVFEAEQPALIVGQNGILRAGWQPAPADLFTRGSGGLPTRRRLPTCPTTSAEFPFVGKLSGIGQDCLPHQPKAQHLNGVPLDSPRRHSKTQSPSVPEPQRHSIPDRPAGAPCPDARPPRPPSP